MSLLPKGPRSDTALHVMGAAVVHVYSDGAATVAYHIRLPKAMYGSKLEGMLEQLVSSARFQQDVRRAVRRTCQPPSCATMPTTYSPRPVRVDCCRLLPRGV